MRIIFSALTAVILLSGCIREGMVECAYIDLTFHYENSTEAFDGTIGNDVQVYLYKDDYLCQTLKIPYGQIRGGKKVRIYKTFDGPFQIAAWAVPKGGNAAIIPLPEDQSNFSTSVIGHNDIMSYAITHYAPIDDIYLGVVKENNDKIRPDAHYIVPMKDLLCRVNVFVESVLLEDASASGDSKIHLKGSARAETLEMEPYGEEICVDAGLNQQTQTGFIRTPTLGIMPSFQGKHLSVIAQCGDRTVLTVETGELAVPGKEITIIIKGLTAEIRVNGWKVKTTSIIFN